MCVCVLQKYTLYFPHPVSKALSICRDDFGTTTNTFIECNSGFCVWCLMCYTLYDKIVYLSITKEKEPPEKGKHTKR